MRQLALSGIVVGIIALVGCSVAPEASEEQGAASSSIMNGQTDVADPAVPYILMGHDTQAVASCSGALIAPRVILTAGHCVVAGPGEPTFNNWAVHFGTGVETLAPPFKAADFVKVAQAIPHPKYLPPPAAIGQFDVGILILAADAPVAPIKLARTIGNLVGQPVKHVGWGQSNPTATQQKGDGTKRMVTQKVTEQQAVQLVTGVANGTTNICHGDSGGPAIVNANGTDVVVGVHSFVDNGTTCVGKGFSSRTDLFVDFISKYAPNAFVDLQNAGAGTSPPPQRGGESDSGECCVNGSCFTCSTNAAMTKCVGVDVLGCLDSCGDDVNCMLDCADQASGATPDPSDCTPTSARNGAAQGGNQSDDDNGMACSASIQCSNGLCRCGGLKAGATCDGRSGSPSSCDVVCRQCN